MNNIRDRISLYRASERTPLETKIWSLVGVGGCLLAIFLLVIQGSVALSLALAAIPFVVALVFLVVQTYQRIFYVLFASHFIFLIFSREYDLPLGIVTFTFNIVIIGLLLLISVYKRVSWRNSWNGMVILYGIWGIFCLAELGNGNTVQAAWNVAITHYVLYPIICAVLVPLTMRRIKDIDKLFIIWSVFIIATVVKLIYQKYVGFTDRELHFLLEEGGARTHIIWSGIRYFSFFTDAANLGAHSAMAVVGFGIMAYTSPGKLARVYYFIIAAIALYAMFLSGTRTAIAIPIGGLIVFTILSRQWKASIVGITALALILGFFRLTTVGQSNEYIRKMRSAFNPEHDASYMVRLHNRELIAQYMQYKPFGYGLGLGGKAERFRPRELMPIPPDSWLINVWADTGIIGFIIYAIIHLVLFAWCSWITMFKIANKRLRNLLIAFLSINAGFFIAAYANDVMQYPNMIIVFTGFALCFAAPAVEQRENQQHETIA